MFRPVVLGALYPGLERGLVADAVAARALGGQALPVCTALVVAGHGRVTDVLDVPADTVRAQLDHLFATLPPTAAKVGIAGSEAAVREAFDALGQRLRGPLLLDLTLSGPSGEDIAGGRVVDALVERMPLADVVTVRRLDAERVCAMAIETLEDVQVAVQRLHLRGARRVALRAGPLAVEPGATPAEVTLLYDGDDFALFESPHLPAAEGLDGGAAAWTMALLHALAERLAPVAAVQAATGFAAEAVRLGLAPPADPDGPQAPRVPAYFAARTGARDRP